MAKTLSEILKGGQIDPKVLDQIKKDAAAHGLTKRIIHIELDLVSGQLKSQASTMDHVMHLGMIEFYKANLLQNMIAGRGPKILAPNDTPAPEPSVPQVEASEAAAAAQPETPKSEEPPKA